MHYPGLVLRNSVLAIAIATLFSACGDSNSDSANTKTFAAPTIAYASSAHTFDLSNYQQIGRYSLPIPDASSPNLLAQEASAITYDWDTDTLFVLGDGGTAVVQVDKTGLLIDSMTLSQDQSKPQGTYIYDPEGLAYLGNGQFALVEERYRQLDRFTYVKDASLGAGDFKSVKLGTTIGNIGIEGISFDPSSNQFIAVKEADPQGVFSTSIDFDLGTASNGSPTTENSVNLFDPAKAGLSTFNDVYALSNILDNSAADFEHLVILSAPDGMVVKIDRSGNIQSTLDVGAAAQNEGLAMDSDGHLYVVSEIGGGDGHPEMLVFAPGCATPSSGSNICLTYNQTISAGTGNLIIDNGAGDERSVDVTDSSVTFAGKNMIINISGLVDDSTYTLTYAEGVILGEGNASAPAVSDQSLQFNSSGIVDTTAPALLETIPQDDTINFAGSSIILTFDESVIAGSGNIVIADDQGGQILIDVTDPGLVRFGGKSVVITPSSSLALSRNFNVQLASAVITDLAGNAYEGINDASSLTFSTAEPPVPKLLISEINSNANGGDFFELYNFGAAAVDLTGWSYNDSAADVVSAIPMPAVTIEAGQLLIVHVGPELNADFIAAWGLGGNVNVITLDSNAPTSAPKLGGGDAVVLFDNTGAVAAAFNYSGADIGAITTATRADSTAMSTGLHAGPAVGAPGTAKQVSAVWDGVSTSSPAYREAQLTDPGIITQADTVSVGTPGAIPAQDNSKLLITEVNSNSTGGDFFELFNFGTASLDLSGWVYDDDSASFGSGTSFPNFTVIPAGGRLVVNIKQTTEAFKSIWGISGAGEYVLLETGSGLSGGDAVVLFDADSNFVTGFNYGMTSLSVIDDTLAVVATLDPAKDPSANIPSTTAHAGPAFGGLTDGTSAVWDGVSTSDPRYTAAIDGIANAYSPDSGVSIGSPGK